MFSHRGCPSNVEHPDAPSLCRTDPGVLKRIKCTEGLSTVLLSFGISQPAALDVPRGCLSRLRRTRYVVQI